MRFNGRLLNSELVFNFLMLPISSFSVSFLYPLIFFKMVVKKLNQHKFENMKKIETRCLET